MKEEKQLKALAELGGEIKDYLADYNAIYLLIRKIGLEDRNNLDLRVRWINNLRDVVSRKCPINKVGAPLVSDVDMTLATCPELAEAVLRTLKLWKKEKQ